MSRTRKETVRFFECGPPQHACSIVCWNGPWEGWASYVHPKMMVGDLHAVYSEERPSRPAETYRTMWLFNYGTGTQGVYLIWVPSPPVEEREEFLL